MIYGNQLPNVEMDTSNHSQRENVCGENATASPHLEALTHGMLESLKTCVVAQETQQFNPTRNFGPRVRGFGTATVLQNVEKDTKRKPEDSNDTHLLLE